MFCDKSYFSAILDRQGLQVAAPIDLRQKKAESFSPQLSAQEEESQGCCDVPDCCDEELQEEVVWQQCHFVYGRGITSNAWRKTLLYFVTRIIEKA